LPKILILGRKVLDCRSKRAVALEILSKSCIGSYGFEGGLPKVVVRVDEAWADDLPGRGDDFDIGREGSRGCAIEDLGYARAFDEREEEWRTSVREVVVLNVMIVASVKRMEAASTREISWLARANRAAVEVRMLIKSLKYVSAIDSIK
jgi:hypothetical protein